MSLEQRLLQQLLLGSHVLVELGGVDDLGEDHVDDQQADVEDVGAPQAAGDPQRKGVDLVVGHQHDLHQGEEHGVDHGEAVAAEHRGGQGDDEVGGGAHGDADHGHGHIHAHGGVGAVDGQGHAVPRQEEEDGLLDAELLVNGAEEVGAAHADEGAHGHQAGGGFLGEAQAGVAHHQLAHNAGGHQLVDADDEGAQPQLPGLEQLAHGPAAVILAAALEVLPLVDLLGHVVGIHTALLGRIADEDQADDAQHNGAHRHVAHAVGKAEGADGKADEGHVEGRAAVVAHGGEAVGQALLLGEPLGNEGVAGNVGRAVDEAGHQGQPDEVGGQGGAVALVDVGQARADETDAAEQPGTNLYIDAGNKDVGHHADHAGPGSHAQHLIIGNAGGLGEGRRHNVQSVNGETNEEEEHEGLVQNDAPAFGEVHAHVFAGNLRIFFAHKSLTPFTLCGAPRRPSGRPDNPAGVHRAIIYASPMPNIFLCLYNIFL